MMIQLKIGLFGGNGSGKSEISLRYLKGEFSEDYIPSIEDCFTKNINIDGENVEISIIDTAGQDGFTELRYSYYKQIQGMILVFDISDPQSIEEIKSIYSDADCEENEIVCAIAANKGYLREEGRTDLVPVDMYKKIEKELNCKVFETNSKTGENINEIFEYIIRKKIQPKASKEQKEQLNKKGPVFLKNNVQKSSSDLLPKRSVSFFSNKSKNIKDVSKISSNKSQPNASGECFSSPMGAEIKSILQSRTKQLQTVTEEKKQLEKKLKEKETELARALEKIRLLEERVSDFANSKIIRVFNPEELEQLKKVKEIGRDASGEVIKVARKQIMAMFIFNNRYSENSEKDDYILSDDDQKPQKKGKRRKSDLEEDGKKDKKKSKRKDRNKSDLSDSADDQDDSSKNVRKRSQSSNVGSISKLLTKVDEDEVSESKNEVDFEKLKEILHNYESLNQVSHPNIACAFGVCFGDASHSPSILLEYFSNNLAKVVKKLTNEERISIIYEISSALKEAHFLNVIHMHLNPDNIFVDANMHAKLTEFGFTSLFKFDSPKSIMIKFPSSYKFFAPELFQCSEKVDEKVDVFSFGVVVYYILTNGELPKIDGFEEKCVRLDHSAFPDSINPAAKKLIISCCLNNYENRPSFENIVETIKNNLCLIDGVDTSLLRNQLQLD